MTQEQKDLLFKDLCSRIPYGVKISVNDNVETLQGINILDNVVEYDSCLSSDVEEVKPYLFPLSRICDNEELRKEFDGLIELESLVYQEFGGGPLERTFSDEDIEEFKKAIEE